MSKYVTPMAWNEPGDSGNKNKNPWGQKGQEGPPDLDKVFQNMGKQFKGMFSGKGGIGNGSILLVLGLLLAFYVLMGFYKVEPPEQAVVLRFGKFERYAGPGLHWLPPIIESKQIVDTQNTYTTTQGGYMLTEDVNIVNFLVDIQYRVETPKDFLFNNITPVKSLEQATESTLRQVVGHLTLDEVLLLGGNTSNNNVDPQKLSMATQEDIQKQVQSILDGYQSGLKIVQVTIKQPKVPSEVQTAYDDVTRALENLETKKNEALAYSNKVKAEVEGKVQRLIQEATAYKNEAILKAKGDSARFTLILPEYKKAPKVTQTRLYLDAVEQVFSNTSKVLVDLKSNSNNLLYLPLDRLFNKDHSTSENIEINSDQGVSSYNETDIIQNNYSTRSSRSDGSRSGRQ